VPHRDLDQLLNASGGVAPDFASAEPDNQPAVPLECPLPGSVLGQVLLTGVVLEAVHLNRDLDVRKQPHGKICPVAAPA